MAPPSDTYRQRGGRPVRQPRISGRTLRQCNIAEISLHNQAQRATNGLHGHQDMNYQRQVWHRTEFNWQRKTRVRQRLGAAPLHRHLAGLLILARSGSKSSLRWEMNPRQNLATITRPVSTSYMHSASIAPYYRQSNNHAARYSLETKILHMARCTLDRTMI